MGYFLVLWVFIYILSLIGTYLKDPTHSYSLFRADVTVIGNFYIALILLFPTQVLLPGWLNWKRFLLWLSPVALLSSFYYGVLGVMGETPIDIISYAELRDSFGRFNVWFRVVLLVSNFVYLTIQLMWLYGQEKRYIQWKNDNFSDQEYVDISWMRMYDVLMVLISVFYTATLVIGGRIPIICHTWVVIGSFSYLFYKTLYYESPYPEDFFASDKSVEKVIEEENEFLLNASTPTDDLVDENETPQEELPFEAKMPAYVADFKKWMDTEKPFLFKDFKLIDVARMFPLNRTYLSRLFNDGFGQSFSDVVRGYRVDYSKKVMMKYPDMPLQKIAELSGFSSDITYIRAFKLVTGVTPNQYKMQNRSK